MTNLSDFGGGIDEPEDEGDDQDDTGDETSVDREFHRSRCKAIKMSSGERCRGDTTGPMATDDLCPHHANSHDPVTVDSTPIDLIEATSGKIRSVFADEIDAWELVRPALHGAVGLEDEPLPIYDDGIWLPARHRQATRLIFRTPTMTVDSRIRGRDDAQRDVICAVVTADEWDDGDISDARNEKCLASNYEDGRFRIGLKIAGEPQEWYPVEIETEEGDH